MTVVYCFSGSGHSLAVANFIAKQLCCDVNEISTETETLSSKETAIVVFPVYCQNIPEPVKLFLQKLTSEYVVLIATYGKISYGNVLYEAEKMVRSQVIAGAYVPTGHTFLNGSPDFDANALMPIIQRIKAPQKAYIPKTKKNLLADISPAWRSRIGVKLIRTNACRLCNVCKMNCPMNAIENGKTNSKCIRCLRCVANCPHKALQFKNRWILQKYLKCQNKDEFKLYL